MIVYLHKVEKHGTLLLFSELYHLLETREHVFDTYHQYLAPFLAMSAALNILNRIRLKGARLQSGC